MSDTYPEHEKLRAIADRSQAIGEFLDWAANEKGWSLMTYDGDDTAHPVPGTIEQKLALFFGIDRDALEREKRQMLDQIREANAQ